MPKYYIVVPEDLNLDTRLKLFPPQFKFNKDFALWVINEIIKSTAYKIKKGEPFQNSFVPECSKFLQYYHRNYRKHLRYLSENFPGIGNILWRQNYEKEQCYSYKLSPIHHGKKMTIQVITDSKLIKKIKQNKPSRIDNKIRKQYPFLIQYIDPERLTLKMKEAVNYSTQQFSITKNHKNYLLELVKISDMKNGDFYMRYHPETDGRIHTNLTGFPKDLRKFLRYDEKRLGEIDISASIPTFLYYLMSNLNNENSIVYEVISSTKSYYNHYMLVKSLIDIDSIEVEHFGNLIKSGGFYNYFIEEFHTIEKFDENLEPDEYFLREVKRIFERDFDGDMEDLRMVMKKNILAMLNAKPAQYLNEEAVFQCDFPSIHRFIKDLKRKNHKHFSHLMLQLESHFMLHLLARKMNNYFKRKIPILTLHDCIITTEDNIMELKKFMLKTLSKELKFTPVIKDEIYK